MENHVPTPELAFQALEALGVGALLLNHENIVVYANQALLEMSEHTSCIGLTRETLLLPPEDKTTGWHQLRTAQAQGIAVEITERQLPSGHQIITVSNAVARYRRERLTRVLEQIAHALNSLEPDSTSLYRAIHRALQSVMDARNFYIALCEPAPDTFSFPYMSDVYQEFRLENLYLPDSLTAYLAQSARAQLISGLEFENFIKSNKMKLYGTLHTSLIGTPLRVGEETVGVMTLQSYDQQSYSIYDLQLLEAAAASISIFIQAKRVEQLSMAARFDALTGLHNRRSFEQHLAMCFSNKQHPDFAVAFIDLDGFKSVNDNFGHQQGDSLLKIVAEHLEEFARQGDIVARLGGDEFAILLHNVQSTADAQKIGQRLIEQFQKPLQIKQTEVTIGLSVGIAKFAADPSIDALLHRADDAMYQAKRAGGFRCVISTQSEAPSTVIGL